MKETTIGVDPAKRVFQLHGAATTGKVTVRKTLTRDQFRGSMAAQSAALAALQGCASTSCRGRETRRPPTPTP